jgi:hypothetical protein
MDEETCCQGLNPDVLRTRTTPHQLGTRGITEAPYEET